MLDGVHTQQTDLQMEKKTQKTKKKQKKTVSHILFQVYFYNLFSHIFPDAENTIDPGPSTSTASGIDRHSKGSGKVCGVNLFRLSKNLLQNKTV